MNKPAATQVQEAKDPAQAASRIVSLVRALRERRLLTLVVEPSSNCNLSCQFCDLHSGRIESVAQYKGFMNIDTWRNLLLQCGDLGYKLKQLQIHGNGEPLLHKQIVEFIQLAKASNISESIRITTNGTLLNARILYNIIQAGVSEIRISVDAGDATLWSLFKGKKLYSKLERNVLNAISVVADKPEVKLVLKYPVLNSDHNHSYGVTTDFMSTVIDRFSRHIKSSNVVLSAMPVVTLMDGMVHRVNPNPMPCEIPFYSLFVKFDGRISVCCADITNILDMGSISADGMVHVLAGSLLRDFRMKHLERAFSEIPICLYCGNRTCVDLSPMKHEIAGLI